MVCVSTTNQLRCAGDMESEKAHLGGIIVRDLSCVVSNYRSQKTLDQYCKEQGVLGASSCSQLRAFDNLASTLRAVSRV